MLPEHQQRILGYFIEEAKEHLNTIEQGLLNLQSTLQDSEMINEVFRAAHSIKGGAAMLGLTSIQHTAHRLEDCFKVLKEHPVQVDQKLESLFLRVSDTLKALLEHLQGPFGLTEETANTIMADAEPVISLLNEHLETLLPSETEKPAPKETTANREQIQAPVMAILREMLQLFKQPATPETRKSLEDCCRNLSQIGTPGNWSNWCNLCEGTRKAIAHPENSYLTLAKIVITDIKQALELVLSGREAEIAISQQLEILIPPEIALLDIPDTDDNNLEQEFAELFINTPHPSETHHLSSLEAEAQPIESDTEEDLIVFEELTFDSEDELANENLLEVNHGIANFAGLSFQLDDDEDDDEEDDDIFLDPNGPEVGSAELHTLAQLFEGETPDLSESWDIEEEILEPVAVNDTAAVAINQQIAENGNNDSELAEFLSLDGNVSSEQNPKPQGRDELTIVQLFGDFLDEEPQEAPQIEENIPKLSPDIIADTVDSDELVLAELTAIGIERKSDGDNLFPEIDEEENLVAIAPQTPEDNLFPEIDEEENLVAIAPQTSEDNLFPEIDAEENPVAIAPQTPEDNLFPEIDTEENLVAIAPQTPEDNLFPEIDADEIIANYEASLDEWNIDSLFSETEEENLISFDSQEEDLIDLFQPTVAIEFSPSQADINSLWQTSTTDEPPELKKDAATALEEILIASANIDDITAANEELENFNEELFSDVFLNTNSSPEQKLNILAESPENSPQEVSMEEIGTFYQQPEAEENTPEFTHGADQSVILDVKSVEVIEDNVVSAISDSLGDEDFDTFLHEEQVTYKQELQLEFDDLDISDIPGDEIAELSLNLDVSDIPGDIDDLSDSSLNLDDDLFTESDNSEALDLDFTPVLNNTEYVPDVAAGLETFAELDDLLQEPEVFPVDSTAVTLDDFADLESLLGVDSDTPALPPPPEPIQAAISPVTTTEDDPFKELEGMLGGSITPGGSSLPTGRNPNWQASRFEQLMKVPVKHLDDLSNLVGELVVNRNTLEQDQERLRQSLDNLLSQVQQLSDVGARMQELYERSLLEASLLASRQASHFAPVIQESDRGFSELEMDRFTPFHTLSQEMIELIVRVRESASDIDFVTEETERVARQFRQVTTQLQEGLTRSRMEPFSQATDLLPRGVRDNAIKYGKQVELTIQGRDTLIDKMILEHLKNPLNHLLNNAIAHGIENPEERQAKGKPNVGKITISAFHQGNQTVISVSDDGAGINSEAVKAKALSKGIIIPEQAKNLSHIDVYDLLFTPGFSTKDKEDELAGRGVGLDVVRTKISEIRGSITIDSKIDQGTTFTIRLPLTLSICKALCCVSDKARVAFPMDGVEDTLDIPMKNIQQNAQGEKFISWRDTLLPFRPLKELLTFNRQLSRGNVYGGTRDDDMVSVVVVRSATTFIALQVDLVLSEQEIVIKQFEGPAPKPIGVAGATVLGDGRIMPIADVLEIIDIFQGRTSKQSSVSLWEQKAANQEVIAAKIDPTVLIIDDSITVRELLSLTFNKAGYRVEQARDGQEAWDKLRSGLPCDLVFCDIEMPRCDGLELLSRIQKDPSLNHLPIAMLTSRGADKHRQMAISLGASGYFTKPYLEEALLEAASRMLKGEKLVHSTSNN
ncbi:response regulator [Calothrix sp. 336/3]|uniref:response regulator n=1 Tax=Calothrix sp. 336/3 TaxID=1337936 RepID=UPI0004E3A128|nr:response regulator [Calothrix sp. 336/3]AKG22478.1 histidine kinase [Calothrix sp. 336/3]